MSFVRFRFWVFYRFAAYRDKKVVGVFCAFFVRRFNDVTEMLLSAVSAQGKISN
jgi:hypothetical protein